ncbi:hypothetical protein [Microbacterium gorillae]|uniref:hypothetical protein n=1 Tax=Microbacterium gorillae TaxID=1231063 RepID=UPI003D967392
MTDPVRPPEGNVYYLFPEWFGGERVPETLSPELKARFAQWNQVWENDLNPMTEIRWSTAEMG